MDIHTMYFSSINDALEQMQNVPGAVLLDVRAETEYEQGHIPGSINLPLPRLAEIEEKIPDRNTALLVYCHSGNRSSRATAFLERLGYTAAVNIGGIKTYHGEVEK